VKGRSVRIEDEPGRKAEASATPHPGLCRTLADEAPGSMAPLPTGIVSTGLGSGLPSAGAEVSDLINLRKSARTDPTSRAVAAPLGLDRAAEARAHRTTNLFETVKRIDLGRMLLNLRRKKARRIQLGGADARLEPANETFLLMLETSQVTFGQDWPEVIVMRWPPRGGFTTNFAVLGRTIYLGAHLSEGWQGDIDSPRVLAALREALVQFSRSNPSRIETKPLIL